MRYFFVLLILFGQFCLAQEYAQNSSTIYRDTAGAVISKKEFLKLLGSSRYSIMPQFDTTTKKVSEMRLLKRFAEEFQSAKNGGRAKRKIGTPAPFFEINDVENRPFSSEKALGKVLVLNFWFIGCAPCRKEMPKLKELTDSYNNRDDIVFFSIADDSREKLVAFLQEKYFGYRTAVSEQKILANFGIVGYPTNIVIDRQGKFSYENVGYGGGIGGLKRAIKKALD